MDNKKRSIEYIPAVSKSKFVTSTLLPLAFFLILNLMLVAFFKIKNPNRGYEVIKKKWTLAQEYQGSIDWLVIGDSACNQGFNNKVFEQNIKGKSLNLCTIGDMLVWDDVWLLEQLIDRNQIPKNIILSHTYDVWQRSEIPELSFQQVPQLDFKTSLDVPYKKNRFVQFFPIIYQVKTIIHLLFNPGTLSKADLSYSTQGQQIITNHFKEKIKKDQKRHEATSESTFKISEENMEAFLKLIDLTKQNNIKLHYVHAPILENILDHSSFKNKYTQYINSINQLCSQHNIKLISTEAIPFKLEELEASIDHISFLASERYTEYIAQEINKLSE